MTKPTKKLTHWPNGNIEYESYWVNDKLHRNNDPAVIWYYKNGNIELEEYWVDGKWYRIDGPARVWYYENGSIEYEEYWVDGVELTKEEFESRNYPKTESKTPSNKCECGAHSIGSSFHSTWCQLYNKG